MKRILSILFVVLFSLFVLGLAVSSYLQYRQMAVRHVRIRLQYSGMHGFLTEQQIKNAISYKDSIVGRPLKELSMRQIERLIAKNPYVKSVDAYLNILGVLIIDVDERDALLRVYNRNGQSFYIDVEGNLFPLSRQYSARVMPANGYINAPFYAGKNVSDTLYRKSLLPGLYQLASRIKEVPFLNAAISQIFVNSRGEVDLVPEVGSHIIHFGTITDVNIKLENLNVFYRQALVKEGWNKYKSINLAYTNQVVCTKK